MRSIIPSLTATWQRRWFLLLGLISNFFLATHAQTPAPCPNLVLNSSFEQAAASAATNAPVDQNGYGLPQSNMPSQVASWQQASWGQTNWFRAGAADATVSVPDNYANQTSNGPVAQPARPGGVAYAGLLTWNDCHCGSNGIDERDYIAQQLSQTLSSGHYYIEFYSKIAAASNWEINTPLTGLGLNLSNGPLVVQPTKEALQSGTIAPQITANTGTLNDETTWTRTAGCFQATGAESVITLGYFKPFSRLMVRHGSGVNSPSLPAAWAMYFIDDVGVFAFPRATFANYTTGCQALLMPSGLLPASSNAIYQWYNSQNQLVGTGPTVVVPASQTGVYSLVITVPSATSGQPAYPPVTTTVTVQPQVVTSLPGGPYTVYNTSGQTLNGTGLPAGGTGTWVVQTANGEFPMLGGGTKTFDNATTGALPAGIVPGTYPVCYTYTSPQGCVGPEECTTLTVLPYSCELRSGPQPDFTLEAKPGSTTLTLDATALGGSPYTFPAGIYRVKAPVVLTYGDFITQPGTVFLFEAGTSLTLTEEGRLLAYDTRFTAACDQMWNGISVLKDSRGLYLGEPSYDFDSGLPGGKAYGGGTLYGEVSHATTAVYWEQPGRTPVRLVSTRFFNNLIGLQAGTYPQNIKPQVDDRSAVVNCVFEAEQQRFKRNPAGQLYADWFPLAHLDLDGWNYVDNATSTPIPFYGNRFADAMFGLVSRNNVDAFTLLLDAENLFENNRVAGIAIPTLTYSLGLGKNTRFTLPPATASFQPSARMYAELKNRYYWTANLDPTAAWGAWIGWYGTSPAPAPPQLIINGASFEPSAASPLFGGSTYPRTGLEVEHAGQRYQIQGCAFTNLRTGLRLGLQFTGEDCEVAGNTFLNCGRGLAVRTTWPNQNQSYPSPVFWPHCNTFVRDVPSGGIGTNEGIIVEASPGQYVPAIVFDNYAMYSTNNQYITPMKNLFTKGNFGSGTFRYLNNQSGLTVTYTVYLTNQAPYPVPLLADLQTNSLNVNFSQTLGPNAQTTFNSSASCGNEPEAFQTGFNPPRPSRSTSTDGLGSTVNSFNTVGLSFPNPADKTVRITYALPAAARAQVVVRDVVRGNTVLQQDADVSVSHIDLNLAALPNGVYVYSLFGDGLVIGTHQLLIFH